MTPHTIETQELMTWLADEWRPTLIFASSTLEPKALYVFASRACYRVTHGDNVVYLGSQPGEAVEAYNSIR